MPRDITEPEEQVSMRLAALGQPARLRVFRALVAAGDVGLTPGAIVAALGMPPTTLSFHLKALVVAGLAQAAREGRQLRYRAALTEMRALMAYLEAHCCDGRRQ